MYLHAAASVMVMMKSGLTLRLSMRTQHTAKVDEREQKGDKRATGEHKRRPVLCNLFYDELQHS